MGVDYVYVRSDRETGKKGTPRALVKDGRCEMLLVRVVLQKRVEPRSAASTVKVLE